MKTTWCGRNDIIGRVKRRIIRTDVVLDIGCGIRPQQLMNPLVHICYEPFAQYIEHLQRSKYAQYHDLLIVKGSWSDAVRSLPENAVDTVVLSDVVEHVEKQEALRLLEQTVRIARCQVVVFTPLGFMPQHHEDGKDAWGLGGGEWQEHKSGWEPEDFGEGWEVFAAKEFHLQDNLGRKLEKPYGALWAIYTRSDYRKPAVMKKRMVRAMLNVSEYLPARVRYRVRNWILS